ncbi:MAG: hypothetical protein ABEJ68_06655 [Halobacteriaceae archaeon]
MRPAGAVIYDRVVADAGAALAAALDRSLTGYAVLEPQDTLLLDGDGAGVLALRDGAPVAAAHTGTGRRGPDAVADTAVSGPYRVTLHEHPPGPDPDADAAVDTGVPADILAADAALAERTRRAAPDDAGDAGAASPDAVGAFLENEEKIEAIRERAREEAADRADEWGFGEAVGPE